MYVIMSMLNVLDVQDYSDETNQVISLGVMEIGRGLPSVVMFVNGKCICFEIGLFDLQDSCCISELVNIAGDIGLDTEESELFYPMIYGKQNTLVDLFPSSSGDGFKTISMGCIDGLPVVMCQKVRELMNEYESV